MMRRSFLIDMGLSRQYSWKEVFEVIQKAAKKQAFVHVARNNDMMDETNTNIVYEIQCFM